MSELSLTLKTQTDELQTKIKELQLKLKECENEVSLVSPYSRSCGRTDISTILTAEDHGLGLTGRKLRAGGWVKTGRVAGGGAFAFLEVNDGTCFESIQTMITKEVVEQFSDKGFKMLITTGTSVLLEGEVTRTPDGTKQPIELKVARICHVGECEGASYPMAKKKQSMEFLRDNLHLRPRTNVIGAVARIRNELSFATHLFFQRNGFNYVHTPIITCSDCEGAGEMFQVTTMLKHEKVPQKTDPSQGSSESQVGEIDYTTDFFGKPSYLTVSGQLEGEAYACALTKIYTFGPTFRAEKSYTSRHLAEFWMIEPEMAFCDIHDDMQCAEDYVRFCCDHLLQKCRMDLEFLEKFVDSTCVQRLQEVASSPFKRISYTDAVAILQTAIQEGKKFEYGVNWGSDLQSEHERYLTEEVFKCPVIVHDYPAAIKSFYMRRNDDGKTVAAMDVLVPKIGELIGGSQREERANILIQKAKESGMELDSYHDYLDLRQYGTVPYHILVLELGSNVWSCLRPELKISETLFPIRGGQSIFYRFLIVQRLLNCRNTLS